MPPAARRSLLELDRRLKLVEARFPIVSADITDGTIVAGDLADGAVTSAKILDGTIATADIAANAITRSLLDSTLLPIVQCTSGTRPSSPAEGQVAYETDTNYYICYTGSAWVMMFGQGSYTPTLTNMAIGTGGSPSNTASWDYAGGVDGGVLTLKWAAVLGTTGSVSGIPNVSLPTNFSLSSALSGTQPLGRCRYEKSTTRYMGFPTRSSASSVNLYVEGSAASYVNLVATSATVPFSWAAGDTFSMEARLPGSFTV